MSDPYLLDVFQEADDRGNVVRGVSLLGHEVTRHLLGAMVSQTEPNPAVANSGSSTRTCHPSVHEPPDNITDQRDKREVEAK